MDIIDLIITVVVIVGSMILSVKKKQKSLSDAEPYDEQEWEFEEEETKEPGDRVFPRPTSQPPACLFRGWGGHAAYWKNGDERE